MDIKQFFSLLAPICLIAVGVSIKFSTGDAIKSLKKWWFLIIICGVFLLAYRLYKLFNGML
jgi:hypothetical protein